MKLDAVLALVKPFLAADAKPDEIKAAILAADKKAKDEFPDKDEPKGKDKGAKDEEKDEPKGKDKAKDKDLSCDKDNDPEGTDEDVDAEDNELEQAEAGTPSKGGASKKPAMDSAEVDRRIAAAVAARDELHAATAEVAPIVGPRAFDSAGAAYKAGLEALGVDLDGVPEGAYRAMLRLAKDRSAPAPIAFDSASAVEVQKLIPNYNRL
jgi:hypothetical protein